jgi:hypothetical protein
MALSMDALLLPTVMSGAKLNRAAAATELEQNKRERRIHPGECARLTGRRDVASEREL